MFNDKAVFLSLKVSILGNSRKVSAQAVDVDADKEMLRVSKQLLDSPEYEAIKSLAGVVRKTVKQLSLPADWLRSGMSLVPLPLVEKLDEKLAEYRTQLAGLVAKFCEMYEFRKADAEQRLKDLYNPEDYPAIDKVRGSFQIEHQYLSMNVPDSLKEVKAEIWERERQAASSQWQEAIGEMRTLLRVQFKELVDHLTDRLTPSPDGKKKIFKDSMIGNFKEFLEVFDMKNIGEDAELADLVGKARLALAGKTANQLRNSSSTKTAVREAFGNIKSVLDSMLTDQPTRAITLPDDEPAAV